MKYALVALCCLELSACSAKAKQEIDERGANSTPKVDDASRAVASDAVAWKARVADIDKLVYHFQDSSVPPQYHRSITLTATPSEIEKVVDSYGEVVSQQANAITSQQFEALLATMEGLGIDLVEDAGKEESGCSGGTADFLTLYAGSEAVLEGSVSSCGGVLTGTLRGEVKQLAKNAEALLMPSTDAPTEL